MNNNLHLTLSNILHNQESVLDKLESIQNELLLDIVSVTELEDDNIYKYPLSTIHHSLVDFIPPEGLNSVSETNNYRRKHKDFIKLVSRYVNIYKADIINKCIIIKSIYKGEDSIALEAYPSKDILKFTNEIANNIKSTEGFPMVKGFPPEKPERFAINLVRFFRGLTEDENKLLSLRVANINKKLEERPIEFKLMSLSLVVSDDYLSNPKPEIVIYNI